MKKTSFKALKIILPLALGILFIWFSLRTATPEERRMLLDNIMNAEPLWLVLSLLFGTLSHMSRAYRWKFMLEPMGFSPRFGNSFMAVMAGYLANFGIPRSGEVLRAATLSTYEKIPFEKAFGTIVSERIADVMVMLTITGITLLLQTEHLLAFFSTMEGNPLSTFGLLIALLLLALVGFWLLKRSSLPFFIRIRKMFLGLAEGMRSIFKMKHTVAFLLHTLFIWTMYLLMFYIISFSVPEMAYPDFGMLMAAFVVGSLAISITNGGIGVYPVSIGAILMLFDISKQSGEAFGWLTWGTQTALVLVLGGFSFIFLPIFNRNKKLLT